MSDRFITKKYRTDCYNCRKLADQIIRAEPYRADVTCDNCGATRVFVPKIEDVDLEGRLLSAGPWPAWKLSETATCRNCHTTGPHDITVSCRLITVRCQNCRFTHLYKFDLEYIAGQNKADPKDRIVKRNAPTCP
ncbi:MAG: hypothetical protein WC342_09450 [Methanoregula sp.]|jgi:hypothetical protein